MNTSYFRLVGLLFCLFISSIYGFSQLRLDVDGEAKIRGKLDLADSDVNASIYIGRNAGGENATGTANTIVGVASGSNVSTGGYNTFIGLFAGRVTTTSSQNTFIGASAGASNIDGFSNTFVGRSSGLSYTASENTFVGVNAGRGVSGESTGSYNTYVGTKSGESSTTAAFNVFIGQVAGYSTTTGAYNTFVGQGAGYSNTIASSNTLIGRDAGNKNETGEGNTIIGTGAGLNTLSSGNTIIGHDAGFSNTTGAFNTYLGKFAGYNSSGSSNVFIGYDTGANETGSNKLYIDNSNTAHPLIYGDFLSDVLRVNGTFQIGQAYTLPIVDGQAGEVLTTDGQGNTSWSNNPSVEIWVPAIQQSGLTYNTNPCGTSCYNAGFVGALSDSEGFVCKTPDGNRHEIAYVNGVNAYTCGTDGIGPGPYSPTITLAQCHCNSTLRTNLDGSLDRTNAQLLEQNTEFKNQLEELLAFKTQVMELIGDDISPTNLTINANLTSVSLKQNIPNPFVNETTIHYMIPHIFENAVIQVTSTNGTIIKEVLIPEKGNGQINLNAQGLTAGNYSYSLIIDGRLIETKQMVFAK